MRFFPGPPIFAVLLAALMFAAAPARAADPLLSGYGGPGAGEQVVLGSAIIPPPHGNGSLRAPARSPSAAGRGANPAPASATAPAPAAPAVPAPGAAAPVTTPGRPGASTPAAASSSGARRRHTAARPSSSAAAPAAAASAGGGAPTVGPGRPPAVAAVPAAPGGASSAGSLPLSRAQVLAALAVLALIVVCAGATATLARPVTRARS
jgi:DNA polymerase-3 subunit gamma/tau